MSAVLQVRRIMLASTNPKDLTLHRLVTPPHLQAYVLSSSSSRTGSSVPPRRPHSITPTASTYIS